MAKKQDDQQVITINISHEKACGSYANMASVTVGTLDVVIDFAFIPPMTGQETETPKAELVQRIILNPDVARRFLSAFQNAVLDFEKNIKGVN